jgi:hypothetical protein
MDNYFMDIMKKQQTELITKKEGYEQCFMQ